MKIRVHCKLEKVVSQFPALVFFLIVFLYIFLAATLMGKWEKHKVLENGRAAAAASAAVALPPRGCFSVDFCFVCGGPCVKCRGLIFH